jgi:hypothetical protein
MFRKPKFVALVLATTVMLLSAVSAFAAVTFHNVSASIGNDGSLSVSFDASGLGTVEDALATLTADGTALLGCFNRGGNHPQASNKETIDFPVAAEETVPVHNGRASGTLTGDAPDLSALQCPGGQVTRLMNVTYSNIVLTVDTGQTSGSITIDSLSRVFIPE